MRYLEVRRHSIRAKPGQHLNQEGVTLARQVGEGLGPFARVLTSTLPRAFETAIAMGCAVDEQIASMSTYGDAVEFEIAWPATFAEYANAVRKGGAAAKYAGQQAKLWRFIADSLPEDGAALLISHGGIIELSAIAVFPDADHAAWGGPLSQCEGVRAYFDGNAFVRAEILRIKRTA